MTASASWPTGALAARWPIALLVLALLLAASAVHSETLGDKGYIQEVTGPRVAPFLYLGAKHMMTG